MKKLKLLGAGLLLFLSISVSVQASDIVRHITPIKALPIAQQIEKSDDMPLTTIDTGIIRDAQGEPARGPHDILFELNADAHYSVSVNGYRVQPGESVTMVINLTSVSHRLILPIYPAEDTALGDVEFTLHIPYLNVRMCPAGFEVRPSDCYRIEFAEINYICPSGFDFSHALSDCRRTNVVPLSLECPSGYTQHGDVCTRTHTTEYTLECPAGFYLESNQCVKEVFENTTRCDAGFTYNSSTGRCQRIANTVAAQTPCPDGFTSKEGLCRKTESIESTSWFCPDSHPEVLLDSPVQCYTQGRILQHPIPNPPPGFPVEPNPICENGYEFDPQLGCVEFTYAKFTCPAGYEYSYSDGMCSRETTLPSGYYCGSTLSNSPLCESFEFSNPGAYCPAGFEFQPASNNCLMLESVPAQKRCTDEYALSNDGTMCQRTEQLNLNIDCPAGMNRSSDGSHCYREENQPATPTCPSGYTYSSSNSRCERPESQEASPTCPSGYTYSSSNNRCERPESQTASPTCPSGYTYSSSNNRCQRNESQNASPTCPSGYTYSSANSRCQRNESQSANTSYSCPSGWERNGQNCTRQTALVGSCLGSIIERPPGMRHDCVRPLVGRIDNRCSYGEDQEHGCWGPLVTGLNSSSCPSGTIRNGNQCTSTQAATITHTCPSGWTRSGSNCSRTLTQSNGWSCPSGWTRSGSNCSRTLTQSNGWSCPSGWTQSGSNCARTVTQSNSWACPSGWSRNGSTCARTVTQNNSWLCPSGWTRNNSICDRTVTEEVLFSCPAGYSPNATNEVCSQLITEDATIQCPAGFRPTALNDQCYRETFVPHL